MALLSSAPSGVKVDRNCSLGVSSWHPPLREGFKVTFLFKRTNKNALAPTSTMWNLVVQGGQAKTPPPPKDWLPLVHN